MGGSERALLVIDDSLIFLSTLQIVTSANRRCELNITDYYSLSVDYSFMEYNLCTGR